MKRFISRWKETQIVVECEADASDGVDFVAPTHALGIERACARMI
jgi:hypothetical protein